MKRILVLSDSHGNVNNMVTAVSRLHPDMIIHLGDCWADAEQLHRKFPMTIMEESLYCFQTLWRDSTAFTI